jgi:hypothetical protein
VSGTVRMPSAAGGKVMGSTAWPSGCGGGLCGGGGVLGEGVLGGELPACFRSSSTCHIRKARVAAGLPGNSK